MEIYIGEKIRELRKNKGISQEKLADYLNVTYQTVSKWETDKCYPEISLLPEIARYFGITVDELLEVERIDEQKLYCEYESRAWELYSNGNKAGALEIWQEAYRKMPNNLAVKEYLMSAYYDTDAVKYKDEIIDIGEEICKLSLDEHHFDTVYIRGQAINQICRTYAENGDIASAEIWAKKAACLMHSREFLLAQIEQGEELLADFRFANYWYFKSLFYMVCRINDDPDFAENGLAKELWKTLARLYEIVYPEGDMDYDMMKLGCIVYRCIAEGEASSGNNEEIVRESLEKALVLSEKSVKLKSHRLKSPMLSGMGVDSAPTDNKQIARALENGLECEYFKPYCDRDWFVKIRNTLTAVLKS